MSGNQCAGVLLRDRVIEEKRVCFSIRRAELETLSGSFPLRGRLVPELTRFPGRGPGLFLGLYTPPRTHRPKVLAVAQWRLPIQRHDEGPVVARVTSGHRVHLTNY